MMPFTEAERIAKLEERFDARDMEIRDIKSTLRAIEEKIDHITSKIDSMRLCASPNMCNDLGRSLAESETRLRVLENERNYARGVVWAVGIMGSVMGAIATLLLKAWYHGG